MNYEKKWQRYTQVGEIFVNLKTYKQNLEPRVSGCIEWRGPRHRQGYGMVGYLTPTGERKMTVAHRIAMRIKLDREIETQEDVRHSCQNNLCCNPNHLYIRSRTRDQDERDTRTLAAQPQ